VHRIWKGGLHIFGIAHNKVSLELLYLVIRVSLFLEIEFEADSVTQLSGDIRIAATCQKAR